MIQPIASPTPNRARRSLARPFAVNVGRALAIVALAATAGESVAAPKIHAGSAAGAYTNRFCPQVVEEVKKEYFEHRCAVSAGTGANVEAVAATPTDIGIGQLDVVTTADPTVLEKLEVVDPGLGLECLYAITSDPSITALSDLSVRIPLALPPATSGSAMTFRKLQELDESLASLRNVTHHDSALDVVRTVANGGAVLGFFVQAPDTENAVFEAANEADLSFVPVINRRILRQEHAGIRLYQPSEVSVVPQGLLGRLRGKSAPTIATTCTKIVLFTGTANALEGDALDDQEALIAQLGKVTPPQDKRSLDIAGNVKSAKEAGATFLRRLSELGAE